MVQPRSKLEVIPALLAASVVLLPLLSSCTSGEGDRATNLSPATLEEEVGYLEAEEEEDIFTEPATDNDPDEPDDSVPDSPEWPWNPQYVAGQPAQALPRYTCADCIDSDCRSATDKNRKTFSILPITHLFGGAGNDRGVIADGSVELNRGISKRMYFGDKPVQMVFAFRSNMVETDPLNNNKPLQLSGWIRIDSVDPPMTAQACDNPTRNPHTFYYRMRGAEITKQLYEKYNSPQWRLRIDPGGGRGENLYVHYLARRDSGGKFAINVIQGLPIDGHPGVANDIFTVDPDPTKNRRFRATRSNTDNLEARVPLYNPKMTDDETPTRWTGCGKPDCRARFVYVRIGKNRYGWIAKRAFTNKVKGTAASNNPDGGTTPCGDQDMPCCAPDNTCSGGLVCNGSTCVLCGSLNEPCCATGCEQGVCTNGTCQDVPPPPCGAAGQSCCSGACNTDRLICDGAQICQPCGDHAQTCCPSGAACTDSSQFCKASTTTCGSMCYARCVDGSLKGPYDAASSADCLNWSDLACFNNSGKGRVEINQINIFDSMQCGGYHKMCCAGDKCSGSYSCKAGPEASWKWCAP